MIYMPSAIAGRPIAVLPNRRVAQMSAHRGVNMSGESRCMRQVDCKIMLRARVLGDFCDWIDLRDLTGTNHI